MMPSVHPTEQKHWYQSEKLCLKDSQGLIYTLEADASGQDVQVGVTSLRILSQNVF